MRFIHTGCGGEIDVKKRQCTRCKKKWDPISFRLDPTGIRPMVDAGGKLAPGGEDIEKLKKKYVPNGKQPATTYASWGDKIPGLAKFAGSLPNWPRWARILTAITFIVVVVIIILIIRG